MFYSFKYCSDSYIKEYRYFEYCCVYWRYSWWYYRSIFCKIFEQQYIIITKTLQNIDKNHLIDQVRSTFLLQFKNTPKHIVLSPGRVNLIGEHTDYNYGLSIPGAIDCWICVALSENKINASNIYSLNYKKTVQITSSEKPYLDTSWVRLSNHTIQCH